MKKIVFLAAIITVLISCKTDNKKVESTPQEEEIVLNEIPIITLGEFDSKAGDFISKEIDQVKSFQDMATENPEDSEEYNIVGAVVSQGEGDVGITYMFKDDYDALEDKTKFENDYGYPPEDIKIAGRDLKFFTFTI